MLVAYLDEKDEASKEIFSAFAELHRDDYLFGISHDAASVPAVTPPAVVLYKSFDEGRNDYEGVITAEGLNDFVADHSTPLLDEISPDNFAMYSEAGLPLAFIFVESTDPKREAITKAIEPIAREYKGTINFVWIDATKVSPPSVYFSRLIIFTEMFPLRTNSLEITPNHLTCSNRSGPLSLSRTFRP